MDIVLAKADDLFFDGVYARLVPSSPGDGASAWARDFVLRQFCSLYFITLVGVATLYFLFATFSYYFIFDHRMMKHPRFLKNQVRLEIESSLKTFMPLDLLTTPWFVAEVRGHSRLYESVSDIKGLPLRPLLHALAPFAPTTWRPALLSSDAHIGGGWTYLVLSSLFFIWFTDLAIYFVHRYEHHPLVYKRIHKPHHRWIIPTPFASHAFHPLDGYAQSLPYHIFVFLFPLHKYLYMGLFVFVNLWSILIHDSEMITDHPLEHIINGPSHHTLHHIYFTCNYGQYLTWADRVGGSYRHPVKGEDPLNAVLAAKGKKDAEKREEEARKAQAQKDAEVLAAALAASLPASSSASFSPTTASAPLPSSTSTSYFPLLSPSSSSSSLSPLLAQAPMLLRTPSTRSAHSDATTAESGRSSPSLLFSDGSESSSSVGGLTSPEWSEDERCGSDEEGEAAGEGCEGREGKEGDGARGGEGFDGVRKRKSRSGTVVPSQEL